ncbi:transcription factor that binds to CRE motif [Exophiala xenobiotica]|uniref:Transcription factor that binds to CRE motif n=1 Tax=Lithohypha guttulata TaxID=1690604 RepID=A0ABR0JZI8_9EURO|nr:transcription factor that binds to CRE motif [Lithohypha guttulata]KAK5313107.1 transcription factor that binds to CRE motif [Exophiala xenobiotica]
MTAYLDASEFSQVDFSRQDSPEFDYPTPCNSSDAGTSIKDEPNKKKRKAWGQPVPEIVPILPPRKRAKTAEEKEQRKNERILRNRRAADKSRQRQKAQQAGLEQQNKDLLSENAQLKEVLRKAGIQFTFTPPPSVDYSVSSELEQQNESPHPVFSEPSPPTTVEHESPCLAPQIDLERSMEPSTTSVLDTGLTQYPAVVLSPTDSLGQHDLDSHTLLDNSDDLFSFNALADIPTFPDFGNGIIDDLESAGVNCPEQFPTDSYFDFDAFNIDTTSDLSHQAPQQTSGMQSQFSASFDDGRRQGFATESS